MQVGLQEWTTDKCWFLRARKNRKRIYPFLSLGFSLLFLRLLSLLDSFELDSISKLPLSDDLNTFCRSVGFLHAK